MITSIYKRYKVKKEQKRSPNGGRVPEEVPIITDCPIRNSTSTLKLRRLFINQ